MERMKKRLQQRRVGVYWLVAGKAKWKSWLTGWAGLQAAADVDERAGQISRIHYDRRMNQPNLKWIPLAGILVLVAFMVSLFLTAKPVSLPSSRPNPPSPVSSAIQQSTGPSAQRPGEQHAQASDAWHVYHNEFFGYSIRFPALLRARPALGDDYGLGDAENVLHAQPIIEIRELTIDVFRNNRDLSPQQWLEDKIGRLPPSITATGARGYQIYGRDAYSIELRGDDFADQQIAIRDKDRMISVSFPILKRVECPYCSLYPRVFDTLTFQK
jgi:hypothetical protein